MQYKELPFATVGPQILELVTATINRVDRQWPASRYPDAGSRAMLVAQLLVAANTYKTIIFFCADKPPDPLRKPEFTFSGPPLARSILEAVFTIVFSFEDFPDRSKWFHRAGWREVHDELERARRYEVDDPRWTAHIQDLESFLVRRRAEMHVSEQDALEPKTITRWPNPGQMLKKRSWLSSERHAFLSYLDEWFYRDLSRDAHLSFRGLVRRSRYLLLQLDNAAKEIELLEYRSAVIAVTIGVLLALLSEIEIEFGFGSSQKLRYVWGIIAATFPHVGELFERRYSTAL